jgi:hypothetical protein
MIEQSGPFLTSTGKCLCGSVRYRIDGTPRNVLCCHRALCRPMNAHVGAYTECAFSGLTFEKAETLRVFGDGRMLDAAFVRPTTVLCSGNGFHPIISRCPAPNCLITDGRAGPGPEYARNRMKLNAALQLKLCERAVGCLLQC